MLRNDGRATEEVVVWGRLAEGRDAVGYPRGHFIYSPDRPAEELHLLTAGQVALHLMSDERRALTLRVIEPGQLFGQIALAGDGAYDTFAEALTPVSAYAIPRDEALAQIERDPALGLALLEDLSRHRQAISHLFDEVAFKSVPTANSPSGSTPTARPLPKSSTSSAPHACSRSTARSSRCSIRAASKSWHRGRHGLGRIHGFSQSVYLSFERLARAAAHRRPLSGAAPTGRSPR